MNTERLMDTEEVAEYLGIHPKTVMNLVERRELIASKIGRVWRFRRSDIDEYIKKQRNINKPPPLEEA